MYKFPETELDDGHKDLRLKIPFAVVGSQRVHQDSEGLMLRGREYPWGTVNIEDQVYHLK